MTNTIAGLAKLYLEAMRIQEETGLPFDDAHEIAKARVKADLINQAQQTAPSGTPESIEPPPYRPRIGWQIALFDAWPELCKLYGRRQPTAAEAIRYLQKHDKTGAIMEKTDGGSLWWKTQRGRPTEVQSHTVENVISDWRARGVLPT